MTKAEDDPQEEDKSLLPDLTGPLDPETMKAVLAVVANLDSEESQSRFVGVLERGQEIAGDLYQEDQQHRFEISTRAMEDDKEADISEQQQIGNWLEKEQRNRMCLLLLIIVLGGVLIGVAIYFKAPWQAISTVGSMVTIIVLALLRSRRGMIGDD